MSLGEIAYEAYHAALSEYHRTHHDHFVQSGGWANLSPSFKRRGKRRAKRSRTQSRSASLRKRSRACQSCGAEAKNFARQFHTIAVLLNCVYDTPRKYKRIWVSGGGGFLL